MAPSKTTLTAKELEAAQQSIRSQVEELIEEAASEGDFDADEAREGIFDNYIIGAIEFELEQAGLENDMTGEDAYSKYFDELELYFNNVFSELAKKHT